MAIHLWAIFPRLMDLSLAVFVPTTENIGSTWIYRVQGLWQQWGDSEAVGGDRLF